MSIVKSQMSIKKITYKKVYKYIRYLYIKIYLLTFIQKVVFLCVFNLSIYIYIYIYI